MELVLTGLYFIAFLLLKMVYAAIEPAYSFLTFTRLVQGNLMQRRRIDRLLPSPQSDHPPETTQMALQWA